MIGEKAKQLVFIGADHRGFKGKEVLKDFLDQEGFAVTDLGTFNEEPFDYPDISREVGEKVQEHAGAFGILLCGSGNGIAMAANKLRGIRAGIAVDESMAEMTRKHNDANILCMGTDNTPAEALKKIARKFLSTEFEKNEERHVRRVKKINEL